MGISHQTSLILCATLITIPFIVVLFRAIYLFAKKLGYVGKSSSWKNDARLVMVVNEKARAVEDPEDPRDLRDPRDPGGLREGKRYMEETGYGVDGQRIEQRYRYRGDAGPVSVPVYRPEYATGGSADSGRPSAGSGMGQAAGASSTRVSLQDKRLPRLPIPAHMGGRPSRSSPPTSSPLSSSSLSTSSSSSRSSPTPPVSYNRGSNKARRSRLSGSGLVE